MKWNREESQPVYVLHTRPYRESSMLVECFSKNFGRVSLVAKGVRQAKSRRAAVLQPFIPLLISWVGRTELYTLCQLEAMCAQRLFSGEQLLCGLYINELLMRVLQREDPHPEIFDAYERVLMELVQASHCERALRLFEKNLLTALGYAFSFEAIEKNSHYLFDSAHGFTPADTQSHETFSGESLLALNAENLGDCHLKEIKKLMRQALFFLLNDKPLKTRELFV